MSELNARNRTRRMHLMDDSGQRLDVRILPDAEVIGRDTTARFDRARLGDDEPGAADGATTEVDRVPARGEAVHRAILAHG
jgi:hypothetical protein